MFGNEGRLRGGLKGNMFMRKIKSPGLAFCEL